jgi:PAS domain S-box-containing protein
MISRDLTASQQIQRELRDSHEYTRGLVEANIDAMIATDPLGIITDVNRQMCALTGHSREELVGTPCKRYFTDPRRAEDGIRTVLAEDRLTNYELTVRSRSGRETVVSCNATTFRSADGRLRGVFASARDITAQKSLEEELRRVRGRHARADRGLGRRLDDGRCRPADHRRERADPARDGATSARRSSARTSPTTSRTRSGPPPASGALWPRGP